MRSKTLFLLSALTLLPACSLVFGGSRYTGGHGDDAGPAADTGVPIDTGVPMDTGAPIDTGAPVDAGMPDAVMVTCTTDGDECGEGSYCLAGTCVGCDNDGDGYAPTDAPPSCITAGLRPGDCDAADGAVHPWALPDCEDRPVSETCGTGNGIFSPDNYEAGYARAGIMSGVAVRDLHVFPITSVGREVRMLVVFRTMSDDRPQFAIVRLEATGTTSIEDIGAIPGWGFEVSAPPTSSVMAAVRSVAGRVTVATFETDGTSLSMFAAHRTAAGTAWTFPVGGRRTIGLIPGVTSATGVGVTYDPSGQPLAAVTVIAAGTAHTLQVGIDVLSTQDVTAAWLVEPLRAFSGAGGVGFVSIAGESQFRLWNGEFDSASRYTEADSGSTARGAYASARDGSDSTAVVVARGGSERLLVRRWRCRSLMTCGLEMGEAEFVDPDLLAADWLTGDVYMVAARNFTGSLTIGALDVFDLSAPSLARRTFEDVAPEGWVDTNVGTRIEVVGASGVATVGVAMSTDNGAELFVLRSCFTLGGG